jgi:glycosyltransferase involved in cell wall biosynthesis
VKVADTAPVVRSSSVDVASAPYPPVTAVVPTHRRPELMRAAVQSIIKQDYPGSIEIIVVFDACAPELPDVQPRPDRTLRAIVNTRARGLAGARNAGILAASHGFIAFLDDDDVWLPQKLTAQMPLFEGRTDLRLVGSAMLVDDGRHTHERLVPSNVVTHDDLIRSRLAGLHSSSFVFRRSALIDEIGLIDEELPRGYGEDYDVLLRTASLAPIELVNEPLVSVRWSGQSYFFGRWAEYAEALTYLLDKHEGIAREPNALARIKSQIAFALAASGDGKRSRQIAREVLRHDPRQLRAWLALAISWRLIDADSIGRAANRLGKGI